ncbi:TlyA family RNA methyltransferase [Acidobacteriota bacterium]
MAESKERLDKVLVDRELAPTRNRARAIIMAGRVVVDEHRIDKAGHLVRPDASIRIKPGRGEFVGRGGDKLQHALKAFEVDAQSLICLDVGASTGGFTQCLLKSGALKVYAVDVGYGQMDPLVRNDPRVVSVERTNARYLSSDEIPEPVSLVTMDVSFISALKILPALVPLSTPEAVFVILIKPQFELGPSEVGKGGIVRSADKHVKALKTVAMGMMDAGLFPWAVTNSPIAGASGNREFFALARKKPSSLPPGDLDQEIMRVVGRCHPA